MNKKTERTQKIYRVFAIYAEVADSDLMIYVGQTRMADLKTALRYYRNESEIAEDLFQPGVHAEIFLLEEEYMTEERAYQRRLAWIRYFFERDYDVIAPRKPYEAALDLFGAAAAYYQRIMDIPVETVLNRRYATQKPDYPEVSLCKEKVKRQEELSRRLSIRLAEKDYQAFSELCNKKGITQKDCLRLLLLNAGTNENYAVQMMREKDKRIAELKKENEKLKQDKRLKEAHKRLKDAFSFARRSMSKFIREQWEMIGRPEDTWEYTHRDIQEYKYPEEEFFYFRLEAIRRGKGRYAATFLLGRDCKTEEKVKLRFYPKEEFCGISPLSDAFYVEGAEFFVGCRWFDPEVADLLCAYPVFQEHKTNEPTAEESDIIDSIIRDAERRSEATR